MTEHRLALLSLMTAAVLAACTQAPTAPPASDSAGPGAPGRGTAPAPAPAPQPEPPVPSGPVSAAAQQQAQRSALAAVTLLEGGQEDQAKAELQRALASDPANKLALSLVKQISGDPIAMLGRESFNYTVRPNDTMSAIAGRFLGDIYSFYILARYNGIAVPRQLAGGHVLRIPGKAPPPAPPAPQPSPSPPPPASPAPVPPAPPSPSPPPPAATEPSAGEKAMAAGAAAEKRGDLERATAEYRRAAVLGEAGADAKAEQMRKGQVQRYTLAARKALAEQDLDGAIRGWDRVLAIDPGNDTAKLERQRAQGLKEKLEKLKTK